MGFVSDRLGFGRKKQVEDTRTALERAKNPKDEGALANSSLKLAGNLLDSGIDGRGPFKSATKVADQALAKHGGDVDKAVDEIISDHLKLAGAAGFLTNLGGFATMIIALPANVLGFYVLATRMSAAVAKLRGYDLAQPEIRSAVLLSLVGADAQDLLAKAGMVAPSGRLAGLATQRLPGPALMVVNKAVGFRILSSAGKGVFVRFGKAVPLVGGVVGAGMDVWLLKQLTDHVRKEFPRATVSAPSA